MRLLHTSSLKLHEFLNESVPTYGILSHTWVENEEVSYQEMSNLSPSVKARSGYQKIINCADTIKELGYDYVWIDTCCIDKSSSAELSESINSMYKWYNDSKVCLVYMVDVHRDASLDARAVEKAKHLERYPHIQTSRWFTRGWTLQELIAPTNVIFYDSGWHFIANIQDIAKEMEQFTGIPVPVLLYGITESYCVAEKMKWASKRRTTRREDMAYCLLGLFDINMPLLYGERDKAFERLQKEILGQSDDLSLFLWQGDEDFEYIHRGLLAQSPAEFSKFAISWSSLDTAWTLPEHFHHKSWTTPRRPCWITNIGIQLNIELLNARSFQESATHHDDWITFFDNGVNPKDDEYVINVVSFEVGPNLVHFYILLKRLEEGGNQFARLRPGKIIQSARFEGKGYQPPPKLETIFIREKLKVHPTIVDPRIYGFSLDIAIPEGFGCIPSIQEPKNSSGQSRSGGVIGKLDGRILLPALVSKDGIVSGTLLTLSKMGISKTFCVLLNFQPWLDFVVGKVDLKIFDSKAGLGLCSTFSFSEIPTGLEEVPLGHLGALGDLENLFAFPKFQGFRLHRGRILARISIFIFSDSR